MIIEADNVSFGYKKDLKVVNNISLNVKRGSVYGFLGPNGAGKTTTIKLLLGLLKPDHGRIKIFSRDLSKNYIDIYKKTGALIGKPSLYEQLSGRDNLEIQRTIRDLPLNRIDEVLKIVDLTSDAKFPVEHYSTGMKQRLGIACALLSDPELIILDEPANALDPNGIIEIRETIRKLNKLYGKTIFLSSHLLNEVEKVATDLAIIKDGGLKFQGSIEQLHMLRSKSLNVLVDTQDNELSTKILSQYYNCVLSENDSLSLTISSKEQINEIIRSLIDNNITIYQVYQRKDNLEDLFFNIIQEEANV